MFAHFFYFLCHSANNVFPNFLRSNSFCSFTTLMADSRHWCMSFSAFSYSGTNLREWQGSGSGEKKAMQMPAWKYSGRLFRLALSHVCRSRKRMYTNDSCQLWGLGGTYRKAVRHPTLHVFLIVRGRREVMESWLLIGKPLKSALGWPDRWATICPSSLCTLAYLSCRPCFSRSMLHNHFLYHIYTSASTIIR